MNQHLLGNMRQLGVANLGNSLAITCDWRLDLAHIPKQLNNSELIRGSLSIAICKNRSGEIVAIDSNQKSTCCLHFLVFMTSYYNYPVFTGIPFQIGNQDPDLFISGIIAQAQLD